ncbi:hypothetical protein T492DRAFT_892828 [Pavlovales sp. CCMP2436]|nr:hypothetical protein T492DRAFT_892828 [Pavlovales sp. CCMP2436]
MKERDEESRLPRFYTIGDKQIGYPPFTEAKAAERQINTWQGYLASKNSWVSLKNLTGYLASKNSWVPLKNLTGYLASKNSWTVSVGALRAPTYT